MRLRARFLGARRQPGEAVKSMWAEAAGPEYPEIPGPVLGVSIFPTTRGKGLAWATNNTACAWPSRPPSHRRRRLSPRQKPTNTNDSLISQTGE